jgi:hypothetical protein
LKVVVKGGGDADDDRIAKPNLGEIAGGAEAADVHGIGDAIGAKMFYIAFSTAYGIDFAFIDIESYDGYGCLRKDHGQGQSDVAQADDADGRLSRDMVMIWACQRGSRTVIV